MGTKSEASWNSGILVTLGAIVDRQILAHLFGSDKGDVRKKGLDRCGYEGSAPRMRPAGDGKATYWVQTRGRLRALVRTRHPSCVTTTMSSIRTPPHPGT